MSPIYLLVYLMVDETLFFLVVRVKPDLTVGVGGVGGVNGFADRGWTWIEKMFSRDIVQ